MAVRRDPQRRPRKPPPSEPAKPPTQPPPPKLLMRSLLWMRACCARSALEASPKAGCQPLAPRCFHPSPGMAVDVAVGPRRQVAVDPRRVDGVAFAGTGAVPGRSPSSSLRGSWPWSSCFSPAPSPPAPLRAGGHRLQHRGRPDRHGRPKGDPRENPGDFWLAVVSAAILALVGGWRRAEHRNPPPKSSLDQRG
jgi:hypothetical protein